MEKEEIKKIAIEKYGKDYEMFQGQIEWFTKGFNEALHITDVREQNELLIKFIQWLQKEYEVQEVHEMYVDEYLKEELMTKETFKALK